jgi:hypothetical protein
MAVVETSLIIQYLMSEQRKEDWLSILSLMSDTTQLWLEENQVQFDSIILVGKQTLGSIYLDWNLEEQRLLICSIDCNMITTIALRAALKRSGKFTIQGVIKAKDYKDTILN